MIAKKSLLDKLKLRIKKSKNNVFILNDFTGLFKEYTYSYIIQTLRRLADEGFLIKIGHGLYAKTRTFSNGAILPNAPIGELAEEALHKLGVKTDKSSYWKEYNAGLTTQMPTGRVIAVDRRVRRKISFNGYDVQYERLPKNK